MLSSIRYVKNIIDKLFLSVDLKNKLTYFRWRCIECMKQSTFYDTGT